MDILWFLIIGGVAGWIGGIIMKGRGFGILGNIVVGIVGGFLGGFLFGRLGITIGTGIINSLATAVIGSVILLFVVGLIKKA